MRTSESLAGIATALSKAQGEMPAAVRDAENTHLRNRYATLGSVISTASPILARHGLSFIQMPSEAESGFMALTTRILHESGEWIEDTMRVAVPVSKLSEVQAAGSMLTFLRRYALSAALGIITHDDDGNGGQQAAQATSKPAQRAQALGNQKTATVVEKAPVNADALAAWKVKLGKIGKRLGELGAHDEATAIMTAYPKWSTDVKHAEGAYLEMKALGLGLSVPRSSESENVAATLITDKQRKALMGQLGRLKIPNTTEARSAFYAWLIGAPAGTRTNELDTGSAQGLIDLLGAMDPAEIEATAAEFTRDTKL